MNYKRFLSKRFLSAMVVAGVIASAPLSRADAAGNHYAQRNLVSDGWVTADHTDPALKNPWGVAYFPGGPFWISDNAASPDGVSTLYDGTGNKIALTVAIPFPAGDTNPGAPGPSGMVWNGNPLAFMVGNNGLSNTAPALFIWATEDGTIAAWQGGLSPITEAVTVVPNPAFVNGGGGTDPVYKGLAIGNNSKGIFLYATNFRDGKVAVWDSTFAPNAALSAKFVDDKIPAGFAPFGIHNINGQLWVTYAKQDAAKHDPVHGAGLGFVDVFDTDGNLIKRFASRGVLDAPWGVVLAPYKFGAFSNDILIGNFGDGKISAWNPATRMFIDWLRDEKGHTIVNDGLWELTFGGGLAATPQVLYFTAGLNGEVDGLFGTLTPH